MSHRVQEPRETLDHLLAAEEPHGTFHDASVRAVAVNYAQGSWVAECALCVGAPNAGTQTERERTRPGRLRVSGLLFWVCEPPGDLPANPGGPLWLTADGPLSKAPTDTGRKLAQSLPAEATAWYLYFSDLNCYAYVAGAKVEFEWT